MPTMTSPFLRTTRSRAGPTLSANTTAQKPGGSLIDASQPPEVERAADFFSEQAAVASARSAAIVRTVLRCIQWCRAGSVLGRAGAGWGGTKEDAEEGVSQSVSSRLSRTSKQKKEKSLTQR